MKAALVLFAGSSTSLQQQAHEINAVLGPVAEGFTHMELWLFHQDGQIELFPEIKGSLSAFRLIGVDYANLPESYLNLLVPLMDQYPMDMVVFPSNGIGLELATRLAYRLNGSSCLKVKDCSLTSGKPEVSKPVYGNNLSARFVLNSPPYCLSVAKQPGHPVKMDPYDHLKTDTITKNLPQPDWVKETLTISDPPKTGLADADRVLVVGQGADSKETVDVLQSIADAMGAELGASRPVVMNAWTDMNRLIGASGLIISPKLCITAGVSGTGVFSVGIKHSEFIVAVNTDPKAPIFQIADVGVVGDLKTILLELLGVITAGKTKKEHHDTDGSRIETE